MESPCIKICKIDDTRGICTGCFRTLDEIVRWARYTDADRRRIMSELDGRRTDLASAEAAQ
ncbi:DUF1289 domain-containing protein [Roseibium denhamense]|uniref:DUF1289 domain-containing protein n=1 Tax=Roseibium denhamense TaxID=76305 RepID=A0ABY1NVA3_9HYPH|nr:DUF1289 domain-containing protein [Roseibium denhamense]MTI08157.1 DUF1289 domain-containing protein [Roseibium denhamense]SMP16829.1 hypothetical protein SAMN06265374_1753 [Roseibium denhamense]